VLVLSHDAVAHEMRSGLSREETLDVIRGRIEVMPIDSVEDGINATRALFGKFWFDKEGTKDGFEALKNYCRDWDEKKKIYRSQPRHDWASHGADAIRQLAMYYRDKLGYSENLQRSTRYATRKKKSSGWGR